MPQCAEHDDLWVHHVRLLLLSVCRVRRQKIHPQGKGCRPKGEVEEVAHEWVLFFGWIVKFENNCYENRGKFF